MMNPLDYLRALYLFLLPTLQSKFPELSFRRALAPLYTMVIIVIIVAAGGLIIYLLVVSGPTTTTYPP